MEVVPAQVSDPARARQVLDDAGWRVGADGTRAKDGRRLAFRIFSYAADATDQTLAVVVQAQMKAFGIDVAVQARQDLFTPAVLFGGDWDAAIISFNTLPTGDPAYMFNLTLARGGQYNWNGYLNPRADALVDQLRGEADPAKRAALVREVQEVVKADIPTIYLLVRPAIVVYRKEQARDFRLHPNDLYLIDSTLAVK